MTILKTTFLNTVSASLFLAVTLAGVNLTLAGDTGSCGLAKDAVQNAKKRYIQANSDWDKASVQLEKAMAGSRHAGQQSSSAPGKVEEAHDKFDRRIHQIVDSKLPEDEASRYQDEIKQAQGEMDQAFQNEETAFQKLDENQNRFMNASDELDAAVKALQQARKEEINACR